MNGAHLVWLFRCLARINAMRSKGLITQGRQLDCYRWLLAEYGRAP